MYKDVKTKLLAVVLSVCMVIGAVEIAPRVKAAASLSGGYYPIKVGYSGAAGVETVYVKLANNNNTSFSYRNQAFVPQVEKVIKDTNDPTNTDITRQFKTELKVLPGEDNINVGHFNCSLDPVQGSIYEVNYQDSDNHIEFEIKDVAIRDVIVDTGLTPGVHPVLKYSKDGVSPTLASVKVILDNDARTEVTLSPNQYEASKIMTAGWDQRSVVTIKDAAGNFTNEDTKTADVICDVAYDLGAGFVTINNPTITYTGSDMRSSVSMTLYNSAGNPQVTDVTMNTNGLKVVFKQGGNTINEVKSAGDYTVEVCPIDGENTATMVSAALYTGKFIGSFTVGRKSASSFKVTAWDVDKGSREELTDNTSTYLYRLPLTEKNASGEVLPKDMVVEVDGSELTADQYSISFEGDTRPTKAGSYTMYITPSATTNYTGQKTVKYYVYSSLRVDLIRFLHYPNNETKLYYTGNPHQLEELNVKDSSGNALLKDIHYEVSYQYYDDGWKDATNDLALGMEIVGKKRVVITGKNAYRGEEITQEYEIARVDMSNPTYGPNFELKIDDSQNYYYTGEEITPDFTFKYYGTEIPESAYNVTWKNNVEAGTATLTVTAKDSSPYQGSKSATFQIEPLKLSDIEFVGDGVSSEASEYSYTGKPLVPKFKIGTYILKDTDLNILRYRDRTTNILKGEAPIDVGSYSITFESNNSSIRGSEQTLNYEIIQRDITTDAGASFLLKVNGDGTIEWNGGDTEPEVICGSMTMIRGTDYEVAYAGNSAPGSATATITGIGNFKGGRTIPFTITPRNIGNPNVVVTPTVIGTEPPYNVSLSVQDTGVGVRKPNLAETIDYEITNVVYLTENDYTDAYTDWQSHDLKRAGEYRVTLTGANKYGDTTDVIITCGTNIKDAKIKLGEGTFTYNGSAQFPDITVSMDGKKPTYKMGDNLADSPFIPTFERDENENIPVGSENIYAGTVYVKATGNTKKGYYGTTTTYATYTIGQLDISKSKTRYEIDLTEDVDKLSVDIDGKVHYKFLNETIKPDEKVKKGSTNTEAPAAPDPLMEGRDYTVSYRDDCKDVGSHWLDVNGIGNFTGTISCSFYIDSMSIDNKAEIEATFSDIDTYAEGVPTLTLTLNGNRTLVEKVDYVVNITREKSAGSAWEDTYVYNVTGMNNFAGTTRVEKCKVTQTTLKKATDLKNPQATEVYVSSWDMEELMVDPSMTTMDKPEKFTLTYMRKNGSTYKLVYGTDFRVKNFVTSLQPGTESSIVIEGINGFNGEVSFDVTLYTDINKAEFLRDDNGDYASVLYNGGSISVAELEKAIADDKLADLITFEKVWPDEANGVVDPVNYTVTLPNGYVPHIGSLTLTVAGTQAAPKYYAGSRKITVTVTGAIDGSMTDVIIGTKNEVPYKGVTVTPTDAGYKVYDGSTLLKGVDDALYDPSDTTVDYTISFTKNDQIGLATAVVRGVNKYSGTLTKDFKITYPLSKLTIEMKNSDGVYEVYGGGMNYLYNLDTDRNKPDVKLYYTENISDPSNWQQISEDLYEVDYSNYTSANNNAKVVIASSTDPVYQGILTGNSKSLTYTLEAIPIVGTGSAVIFNTISTNPLFSGVAKTLTDIGFTAVYDNYTLKPDEDYTVTYYNNINVSDSDNKARAVITAMGNFTGTYVQEFTILPMPISSTADIEATAENLFYTGNAVAPKLTIQQTSGKIRTLVAGTDYEIVTYMDQSKTRRQETPYTNVGTYYIQIKGIGNYNLTRDIEYKIQERQMDDGVQITFVPSDECPVIGGMPNCEYNGSAHTPTVQVVYNNQILKGDAQSATPDYTVTYENNVNAGTATVKVTGNGSFGGTKEVTFTIKPRDISGDDFEYQTSAGKTFEDEQSFPFDGNAVEPGTGIKVIDHGITASTLVFGSDYTVEYKDNNDDHDGHYNAGKVIMTIKGQGNYGGEKIFTYYIGEDISQLYALVNGKTSYTTTYNGLKQAPLESDISVGGTTNIDLTDPSGAKRYAIAYYKNGFEYEDRVTADDFVDAGNYYVSIIGVPSLGTYSKTSVNNSCTYTINPRSIANSTVSGYEGMYYYNMGQPICPTGIVVTDTLLPVDNTNSHETRSVELKNGVDYTVDYANNVNAGKATIIIAGKGNYTGNVYGYFTIDSSNVSGDNVYDGTSEGTGSISNGTSTISAQDIVLYGLDGAGYMSYNGSPRTPSISINKNGVSVNDFTVTASNNINPGVATLMIVGNGGNYTGVILKSYMIKADLSRYGTIASIPDQVYTGTMITPNITLSCAGNILIPGVDYTVTYSNNNNQGRATVMAQATSNSYYVGTATSGFNIGNQATGMQVTGYASSYTYTGYAITPDVVVTMNGRTLTRGTDYTVTYSNNINVGTATMTVMGRGSYSGTQTIRYTIEAKNIENCITTAVNNYQYSGGTYTPSITVTDSSTGKVLVAGSDYTITYSNNTNPGTASITVTALSNNYTGSKVIPFKITSAAVSGLRTSTIKNNSIKLVWSSQDYADGYQICNSSNRVVATTTKNSYTVKGLTSYKTYKFKVRSYVENADGSVSYGDFSTAVSAKTLLATPKLTAKSTTKGKVTLTWTKVGNATGYEIYYSTKKNGVYTKLKTITKPKTLKYVDSGLASGEKYYYTIRAYRTSNGVKTYSSYNTIKSAKVK